MKLKVDLHDIYNRGGDIDRALRTITNEAVARKLPLVEIIPGKGSGALKKHVLRFLDQKEIKTRYHRVEKDGTNFGRVFVHFRWKRRPRPPGQRVDSTLARLAGELPSRPSTPTPARSSSSAVAVAPVASTTHAGPVSAPMP